MRVLLKISGEAFTTSEERDGKRVPVKGIKREPVDSIIREVRSVWPAHQVAVSIGGGNIGRGSEYEQELDLPKSTRVATDWMGMIATYINGIALKVKLELAGTDVRLMLAKPFGDVGEPFYHDVAMSHLTKGRVIVLAGGTGKPRFTTDTGAILSAIEVQADLVLKGTKVDGIYDRDPLRHGDAVRITHIGYDDYIKRNLGIMDITAVAMARKNDLPIRVFDIFQEGSLRRVLDGVGIFSEIS